MVYWGFVTSRWLEWQSTRRSVNWKALMTFYCGGFYGLRTIRCTLQTCKGDHLKFQKYSLQSRTRESEMVCPLHRHAPVHEVNKKWKQVHRRFKNNFYIPRNVGIFRVWDFRFLGNPVIKINTHRSRCFEIIGGHEFFF
jgi:hypothetical protein